MNIKIRSMSPQLLVADLNRSVEFYTGKLGFEESFRHEDFYSGIVNGEHSIHLKLVDSVTEERQSKKNYEHLDITFSVDGIEDLYNNLRGRSVEVTQSLRTMPYGQEFYIADPDGNIIAFVEAR
jgi:catechol 2,3-dioxygenase-like lactoylglutathione lyase family enzyme